MRGIVIRKLRNYWLFYIDYVLSPFCSGCICVIVAWHSKSHVISFFQICIGKIYCVIITLHIIEICISVLYIKRWDFEFWYNVCENMCSNVSYCFVVCVGCSASWPAFLIGMCIRYYMFDGSVSCGFSICFQVLFLIHVWFGMVLFMIQSPVWLLAFNYKLGFVRIRLIFIKRVVREVLQYICVYPIFLRLTESKMRKNGDVIHTKVWQEMNVYEYDEQHDQQINLHQI